MNIAKEVRDTKKHFGNLLRIAGEEGLRGAVREDFLETCRRHPALTAAVVGTYLVLDAAAYSPDRDEVERDAVRAQNIAYTPTRELETIAASGGDDPEDESPKDPSALQNINYK